MTAGLDTCAGLVQRAVAHAQYTEARRALEEYGRAAAAELAGMSPGDPRIRRIEIEWRRLLDETRRQVLAGRAQMAVRLARLSQAAPRYGGSPGIRHTWECLG